MARTIVGIPTVKMPVSRMFVVIVAGAGEGLPQINRMVAATIAVVTMVPAAAKDGVHEQCDRHQIGERGMHRGQNLPSPPKPSFPSAIIARIDMRVNTTSTDPLQPLQTAQIERMKAAVLSIRPYGGMKDE